MTKPTILVTGATGKTGAAVVARLRAKGYPVRAAVRIRDARSEALERLGADIVVADLRSEARSARLSALVFLYGATEMSLAFASLVLIVDAALYEGTDDLLIGAGDPHLTWRQIADIIGEKSAHRL